MSKCILLQSNFHGHTDTYLVCLQQIRIHGRGILRPPVRVVDEPLDADTVAPIEGQALFIEPPFEQSRVKNRMLLG